MKTAIILNNETLGKGDDELGSKLMGAFLRKLWVKDKLPEIIVCYNSAVKLVCIGSPVLDAMAGLYEKGVEIIACGTCLDHYELGDKIHVGRRTDMVEIVTVLMDYDKVITV